VLVPDITTDGEEKRGRVYRRIQAPDAAAEEITRSTWRVPEISIRTHFSPSTRSSSLHRKRVFGNVIPRTPLCCVSVGFKVTLPPCVQTAPLRYSPIPRFYFKYRGTKKKTENSPIAFEFSHTNGVICPSYTNVFPRGPCHGRTYRSPPVLCSSSDPFRGHSLRVGATLSNHPLPCA